MNRFTAQPSDVEVLTPEQIAQLSPAAQAVIASLPLEFGDHWVAWDSGRDTLGRTTAGTTPAGLANARTLGEAISHTGSAWSATDVTGDRDGQNKAMVVANLSARSGLSTEQVQGFVNAWAQTSSDHDAMSLALQTATAEKFGLPEGQYISAQRTSPFSGVGPNLTPGSPADYHDSAAKFVDAMYAATQEKLAAAGVTELTVSRGVGWPANPDGSLPPAAVPYERLPEGPAYPVAFDQNPASAWSLDPAVAYTFATGLENNEPNAVGYTFRATVPASRVLSSPISGVGATPESEVVLIGGSAASFGTVSLTNIGPIEPDDGMFAETAAVEHLGNIDADQRLADWLKNPADLALTLPPGTDVATYLAQHHPDLPIAKMGELQFGDQWVEFDAARTGTGGSRLQALQNKAMDKVAAAPKPTRADVARYNTSLRNNERAGGDMRLSGAHPKGGGPSPREVQAANVLREFGGRCVYCGRPLGIGKEDPNPSQQPHSLRTTVRVTLDKIYPENGYRDENLLPACYADNLARGNDPFGPL